MSSYWHEIIEDALTEAGVAFTSDQLSDVVASIEIGIENEGMATGRDCIPNPLEGEMHRQRRTYEAQLSDTDKRHEQQVKDLEWAIRTLRARVFTLEQEARAA